MQITEALKVRARPEPEMAGSKPAIGISIISKLLKLLIGWIPSTPLHSPLLPPAVG
jgi:hypothetical protein